ncbi:Metallo-beta-lactamase superfamily protein [compost metagenome]
MRPINLLLALLLGFASLSGEAAGLRFSLVKTAETKTLDALTVEGDQWTQTAIANHVAVLIEHHAATLLFDTSLGRQVDSQFASEMPWYDKQQLQYGKVNPVRDQLDRDGIRVDRILLSHVYWDHASGLADFPEVPVWAPYAAIEFSRIATPPAVLPSQFQHRVKWLPYEFAPEPFMSFDESHDLFGDGSLVLVPLSGHTPGSVGLFITLDDGRRFFFSGDASWHQVDHDHQETRAVQQVHHLLQREPTLTVVPAHDAKVHEGLGYYPNWTR